MMVVMIVMVMLFLMMTKKKTKVKGGERGVEEAGLEKEENM